MTDYTKSTNFASKDTLSPGSALKIVRGTEIDTEFNNIATAVATKADLASPALTGTPTAPTPTAGDNDTSIATTAFVSTAVSTAVGALGNTFGFKNRIINGQGLINQRAVSGTVSLSAGVYGHDRFKAGASGCTYTFATSNNVTTFTISAGSLIQVVEGLNLESGTYALSWTGTAQGKIGAGSFSASGVTGSITGGTNTNIEFNTGTLSLPQLEKSSTATSFDYRPYGTELMLCQRYYQTTSAYFEGVVSSGSDYAAMAYGATQMRATPTVAGTSTSAFNFPSSAGTLNAVDSRSIYDRRRASGTGAGSFTTSITLSAEL
jgi:hypothetical protein